MKSQLVVQLTELWAGRVCVRAGFLGICSRHWKKKTTLFLWLEWRGCGFLPLLFLSLLLTLWQR